MVMRGYMVKRRKDRLSHMIFLGAQISFDIHIMPIFQNTKFLGHQRSMKVSLRSVI